MIGLFIVLGIIALLVVYVISVYNKLVNSKNKVENQWSQIDVQLKRRADLIPNLVETVKGYAKHEEGTLTKVIEMRNKAVNATTVNEKVEANNELTGALSRLMVIAEAYPELKANENFNQLQDELSETEDKVASARQFYSDSVLMYNNKIQMFPSNLIAGMFGFKEEKFFEATDAEKENVQVKFD